MQISKFNHSLIYTDNKYDALYYIALCYIKLGDYKFAQEYAQKALEVDNSKVDSYIILADCYLNTCQEQKCLDIFNMAEKNAQTNTQFYTNWGLALQKYNYIDQAREKFYRSLCLNLIKNLCYLILVFNFL